MGKSTKVLYHKFEKKQEKELYNHKAFVIFNNQWYICVILRWIYDRFDA